MEKIHKAMRKRTLTHVYKKFVKAQRAYTDKYDLHKKSETKGAEFRKISASNKMKAIFSSRKSLKPFYNDEHSASLCNTKSQRLKANELIRIM